jgi:hypothetical protein
VKYEIVEDDRHLAAGRGDDRRRARAAPGRLHLGRGRRDPHPRRRRPPYVTLTEEQILAGALANYDWLHIHHEDFTGEGDDESANVPTLVSVTDKTGTIAEGPGGGTIWIKGSGFLPVDDGHRNIKVWFENTQLRLTDTATYSTDFLSADGMLVNATDTGLWEITALVPALPNGTYRVYAQVLDDLNGLTYKIVGSTIAP